MLPFQFLKNLWPVFTLLFGLFLGQCSNEKRLVGEPDKGGLFLPEGFEAVVVADSLGRARHLAVNSNGDIYVKLRYPEAKGENLALRDNDGDGKADLIKQFGNYGMEGKYGTAMRIHKGYLYFSTAGKVFRQKLTPGKLVPDSEAELLLVDDYKNAEHGFEHIAKPITFDHEGHMYVPFGSPGDVCQIENRKPGSLGQDPCPELEWHGGVWQFDEARKGQTQQTAYRYATGIRSIVAMDWNPANNTLYALQHGRDNLNRTWPDMYNPWESALLPSEEFFMVKEGTDGGWPYYYYDQLKGKKLLNPEYGGDGQKEADANRYEQPLIGFPGHFAPNDLHFYQGDQFPERYRNGAFIAFHGSTIRAPYPQAGYFVGFVPFKDGKPSGPWEVFADGFAGVDTILNTSDALGRPMGIAMGPDGSLYISESVKGKVWRIFFNGNREEFGAEHLVEMEKRKQRPNIKNPDEINDKIFQDTLAAGGNAYELYCSPCHQQDGNGDGTRYPPLKDSEWLVKDSRTLVSLVINGMSGPITVKGEGYESVMPAMAYLTDEEIADILSYVRNRFASGAGPIQAEEVAQIRNELLQ